MQLICYFPFIFSTKKRTFRVCKHASSLHGQCREYTCTWTHHPTKPFKTTKIWKTELWHRAKTIMFTEGDYLIHILTLHPTSLHVDHSVVLKANKIKGCLHMRQSKVHTLQLPFPFFIYILKKEKVRFRATCSFSDFTNNIKSPI